jgi:hypothetical protein
MKPRLALLLLIASAAAPPLAGAAPSDRHPGIYRFRASRPAECALKERQALRRPVHPSKLGDLPPAYVIRLSNPAPPRQAPVDDPCATLERVK